MKIKLIIKLMPLYKSIFHLKGIVIGLDKIAGWKMSGFSRMLPVKAKKIAFLNMFSSHVTLSRNKKVLISAGSKMKSEHSRF